MAEQDHGTDLAGITALDWTLSTVGGKRALAHAILRRLTTPRGGLFYDPTYGYNVPELIGSTVPASIVEQRVLEQVLAEEEVEDARCTVTLTGSTLRIEIQVVAADGPFDLVLTQNELTLEALLDGEALA
nr:MAG: hypothetical protein DIU58_17125 [Sphaerobacter thermophilus]